MDRRRQKRKKKTIGYEENRRTKAVSEEYIKAIGDEEGQHSKRHKERERDKMSRGRQ